MKRRALSIALLLGCLGLLVACAGEGSGPDAGDQVATVDPVKPVGGDLRIGEPWYLVATSADSAVVPAGLTITFEAAEVSGQAPVNFWSATYAATGDGKLQFGEMVITARAGPDDAMRAEAAFVALLGTVDGYTAVAAGELFLFDDQAGILTYSANPPVEDPLAITPETEALAASVVGLSEADAEAAVVAANHTFRVVARDGEQYAVTEDYSTTRINVTVESGQVTQATIG